MNGTGEMLKEQEINLFFPFTFYFMLQIRQILVGQKF